MPRNAVYQSKAQLLGGLGMAVPLEQQADGTVTVHCQDGKVEYPAMAAHVKEFKFLGTIGDLPDAQYTVISYVQFHVLNQFVIGMAKDAESSDWSYSLTEDAARKSGQLHTPTQAELDTWHQ